ncbi:peptidylprolyl isomerase [Actinobacillus delphinicola]|uniref:Peptidyl-prolyl cis-trans isomerase n=1 Tax=Actinobacillus delphinicola TaxID=51161 RepID=A0A448TUI3_9PAST|nr:FKBP-type peptidyl-prolyl cis-trans isomerase [Actinobacillus delphinicola]MDG6897714.1 peptidylprolyl isomerase [Actinobacillus delphinicola]VEJ09596.1 FKBP-type peptidylprolyl isomerase [Actinobacillus delphinicola]
MTDNIFENVDLSTTSAKGSYGIGLQIGQQLLESKLEITPAAVGKGIYDVLMQQVPALELMDVQNALLELQKQASEVLKAEAEAAKKEGEKFLAENAKKDGVKVTDSGLQYEVLKEGNGKVPSKDDHVRVHYTGKLPNGTVFDSSVQRGQPAEFPVGGVIPGWVEALTMMPVGSKWKLVIPAELAYGERGAGAAIPPNSPLEFEVELLDIL